MPLLTKVFLRNMSSGIKHVSVIGGGLMGSGIAQVVASHGFNVSILELHDDLIADTMVDIKKNLESVAAREFKNDKNGHSKFVSDSLNRIQTTTQLTDAVIFCDIVIEAICESIKFKHEVFEELDKVAPKHTIFTSNTCSLRIAEIASVTNRKDRFAGLHFFNPVQVMNLLEVTRINETSDETFQRLKKFGAELKKTCVSCRDTPGFIVNRLLIPYIAESIRMLERGDATARDIDTAMRLGAGHSMGPFALTDFIGLDNIQHILNGWHAKYPENSLFRPSKLLDDKVKARKYGIKSGEGFFSYKK